MKSSILQTLGWFSLLTLISSIAQPTTAQPITPAPDGTGTRITPDGQRYDINGGTLSRDGSNLFHSFQQFGLNQGETANFITNPQIHNILGRVVGGDPSIINGLIQITGGTSNLFLMNPAGILFGPNASLNIPADFTATTASGIGFGNSWFNSFGTSDYANLVGTPSAFSFNMSQLGTIINEGNLTLTNGSNLNLFANTVINTGTLATPFGNINIIAVPSDSPLSKGGQGASILRISQPGHILSLEIENRFVVGLQPKQSLPELLTGGDPIHHATTVQKLDDGTIILSGSQTPIPNEPGVAVVSGNVDVGGLKPNYELNILGDKIALIGANIDASGANSAGNIHIGGNYQGAGPLPNANHTYIDPNTNITANAINSGNGGQIIIWSDNTTQFHGNISATGIEKGGFVEVSGKQNLIFRGNVDLSAPNGNNGSLLLDPENIIIVDGSGGADDSQISDNQILFGDAGTTFTISETTLESLDGNAAVELQATNDITIEDLTDNSLTFQSGSGAITFTADADNDGSGAFTMIDPGDFISAPGRPFTINAATITLANIETNSMFGSGGDITLNATGDIIAGNIFSVADSQAGAINITSSGGQINLSPFGSISSMSLFGSPGNITLKAAGNITTSGITASNVINPGTGTVNPGNITIESTGGAIDTTAGYLQSSADGNSSGSIQLKAAGDIRTGGIDTSGLWAGTAGSISLESTGGIIDTSFGLGTLNSFSTFGVAGDVTLKAAGDITTGDIMSHSGQQGGNITITSINGLINAENGDLFSNGNGGNAGHVTLEAAGNIATKSIMSFGAITGGNVTVNSGGSFSSSEQITTYASDLISSGVAGNVDIHAASDITLGTNGSLSAIQSTGEQQGGSITITSDTGKITANADIFLSSQSGTAGNVTLDAPGNIERQFIKQILSDFILAS
ncbi:MAG TPA: filamentous hemagglutinin N-terminal domain-containing protein [Oscillatoriaceae cyanobacterium M33_DOE_052]|nr:filamentous hemagglutinin N-terminal domain-containing protein [Oscillatoriaceae cyanobacterium M33_DOE_052]